MNTPDNRLFVRDALERVAENCRLNRALILTESDLKCQVYMELNRVPTFGATVETIDRDIRSNAIHTETKFFNHLGLLSEAPDLVITDPSRLSIQRRLDGEILPTKGFHFDGATILIELKFLRNRSRLSLRELERIEKDIMKGEKLNRRGDVNFHLFVAVYDRFRSSEISVNQVFDRNRHQRNLSCIYFPGGPVF